MQLGLKAVLVKEASCGTQLHSRSPFTLQEKSRGKKLGVSRLVRHPRVNSSS